MAHAAKVIEGEVEQPKAIAKREKASVVTLPIADQWLATVKELAPVVGIEGVRELMKMRREEQEAEDRRAFNAAMAEAKQKFKPIIKRNVVQYENKSGDTTSYKHENLGDISEVVEPIMGEAGLFFRFRGTSNLNEPISVTCIISHRSGYSEETTLRAGADTSGGKNSIQAVGSTVTYLQRYTLRLALGLATAKDDDGKAAGSSGSVAMITDEEIASLKKLMERANIADQIVLDAYKVANLAELTKPQRDNCVDRLNKKIEAKGKSK